jgi:ribonuclease VapC
MSDGEKVCSAVTAVEALMVLSRVHSDPRSMLDAYLRLTGIAICAVDEAQSRLAMTAFLLFGKGRDPARLNLGDCFSYAAAKALDAPLLYVGGDFPKTDIRAA